jgi:hypothetical protein
MTLNHVAKRASKSQGVALLTLYSKGFSPPAFLAQEATTQEVTRETRLVDQLKLTIRREDTHGHLPICWGVLTGALQLSLGTVHSHFADWGQSDHDMWQNAPNTSISSYTPEASSQPPSD